MSRPDAAGELHSESPAYFILAAVAALVAIVFGGMSSLRAAPPRPAAVVQTAPAGVDVVSPGASDAPR